MAARLLVAPLGTTGSLQIEVSASEAHGAILQPVNGKHMKNSHNILPEILERDLLERLAKLLARQWENEKNTQYKANDEREP